jgi:predicted MFS family arabinose efflux permease
VSTRRIPPPIAFGLLTLILVSMLSSSNALTPLYPIYEARWDLSALDVTAIFGVYAFAVLASLLVLGSLSDHVGRRPVTVAVLILQAGLMAVFATASGLDALLVARVAQGLVMGAAVGAVGAWIVDLDHGRGPVANATGTMAGGAVGALVSALFVQLLPDRTQLIYFVLMGVFLLQAAAVMFIAETSPCVPGARRALRPMLAVPRQVRSALVIAAPSLVAVWALAGFYGSLGPSLAAQVAHAHSPILGGASLFVLAGTGTFAVVASHRLDARSFALAGTVLVIAGVIVVLLSVSEHSTVVFFVGTATAGAGFGAGFQGGIRTVVPLAGSEERAGVVSVVYVICYLAMGLPAILAGLLITHGTLVGTARGFGVGVIALAAVTGAGLVGAMLRRREERFAVSGRDA